MFCCQDCESSEFHLVLHPSYQGEVEITVNEDEDVIIEASGQRFVADLMFMNQFAICDHCGATRRWAYHYSKTTS